VERYESHPHSQLPSIGGVGANTSETISRSWSIVIRAHDNVAKSGEKANAAGTVDAKTPRLIG
jgi:hypothetical protein